jgi:hypothetical protein
MSPQSPPEAFPIAESARPGRVAARTVRGSGIAMAAGTAALVGGVLLELGEGLLVAGPEGLALLARLQAPLLAIGQVLLVGGAIVRRIAWKRQQRAANRSPHIPAP